MKDEEKNLIENLFYRLKNTELNSSQRDESADNLIQNLVKAQPASSYYMVQTILIQETAIKKMNMKIEELKKRIETMNLEGSKNKPSFLSNFFNTNSNFQKKSHDSTGLWKNKDDLLQHPYSANQTTSSATQPPLNTTRSSGFLSNALQTATGVAGGMILGNMLMNVFNHTKPEEEIFDNVDKSSLVNHTPEHHIEENSLDHNSDNNLIHHEENNESDLNSNESDHFQNISDTYDEEYDTDDDNFI